MNRQGQTFSVFEGPVEFRMGSPPTGRVRASTETQHRQRINRRFAVATKEVTVDQYQRSQRLEIDKGSHDPNGLMVGPSWYDAAHTVTG